MVVPGMGGGVSGTLGLHPLGNPCSHAGRAGWRDVLGGRLPSPQAGAPVWGLVAAGDSPGTPVALKAETVPVNFPLHHCRTPMLTHTPLPSSLKSTQLQPHLLWNSAQAEPMCWSGMTAGGLSPVERAESASRLRY